MKNKFPYTVTPEVDKQIKTVAEHLPVIQQLNPKGEPLYSPRSKSIPWAELSDEDKKKFPVEEFWPRRKGENFDRPKLYIVRWKVPVTENHYMRMYWIYREFGDAGVAAYVDQVNAITERSKKAAQEVRENEETSKETAENG